MVCLLLRGVRVHECALLYDTGQNSTNAARIQLAKECRRSFARAAEEVSLTRCVSFTQTDVHHGQKPLLCSVLAHARERVSRLSLTRVNLSVSCQPQSSHSQRVASSTQPSYPSNQPAKQASQPAKSAPRLPGLANPYLCAMSPSAVANVHLFTQPSVPLLYKLYLGKKNGEL